jgi:hypothetical protein
MDYEALTLNEVEEVEKLTGVSIDAIANDGQPKGRVLKVLIWVMKKRENSSYTLDEAGKLTLAEAVAIFGGDADPKEQ